MDRPKLIVGLVLALAILASLVFIPIEHLTLENLQFKHQELVAYSTNHFLFSLSLYAVLYILITALSLPGATILTLAGGAVFDFVPALLIISFASTIGATLAFMVSRFLLRDILQNRFSHYLAQANGGIEREGAFYLFALRLVPAIPFFLINIVMGLTPMKISTFYLTSQIGMLPGTMVYLNAGSQLSQITSIDSILSPALLTSFALLGILPLASRRVVNRLRTRCARHNG